MVSAGFQLKRKQKDIGFPEPSFCSGRDKEIKDGAGDLFSTETGENAAGSAAAKLIQDSRGKHAFLAESGFGDGAEFS